MPRMSPDRLPAELQPILDDIRPPRRVQFGQKKPANLFDSLLQAALVCPRYCDIAAFYWVDEMTFAEWRKQDSRIDIIINQARQADTQEILLMLRQKAKEGNVPAAKLYLEKMRPDLSEAAANINVNTSVRVSVLPTPPQTGSIKPPKGAIVEGTVTEVTQPGTPQTPEKKTPLFGGKDLSTPEAPPAKGLQRG